MSSPKLKMQITKNASGALFRKWLIVEKMTGLFHTARDYTLTFRRPVASSLTRCLTIFTDLHRQYHPVHLCSFVVN